MKVRYLFLLVVFLIPPSGAAQTPDYLDVRKTVDERVIDLVSKMTLKEKVSQMLDNAPAIKRLNIPAYNWWNEGLHGVARSGLATSFPQAIALAATWNRRTMNEVATVISDEARAKYNVAIANGQHGRYQGLTFWSPNINIFRDPRWGRGQETYGEDPYLTGEMAVQFIHGMQGNAPRYYKVVATAKHFAVHSGPESERHKFEASVSEYDLRETYLPAFRVSVMQGKVASLMCAYNSLRGKACCSNDPLLNDILRHEWGFTGYVVSDCGAIYDISHGHKQAAKAADASALAVKAGTDLECGHSYARLGAAVRHGLISSSFIDTAVKRLFTARMKLGMFDPPTQVPYSGLGVADLDSKRNRQVALDAARESIVLLKNDKNILPLSKSIGTIAVIGPNANDTTMLLGNYNGSPSHTVSFLEGIRNAVSPNTRVLYERGCGLTSGSETNELAALEAIKKADAVVLCMGLSPRLEGEEMNVKVEGFSGGDRTSLDLPSAQENFIKKVMALGKPVVLVLANGSALSINWENETIPAIVETWYGGQAAGAALADILFGDYNPSGRLPITFYKSVSQLPDFRNYDMQGRTYRYFKGDVLYPFGFGLSYTRFELSELKWDTTMRAGKDASVSVLITNTGPRAGAGVVELYVQGEGAIKTLRGFEKVYLSVGGSTRIEFSVSMSALTFYKEGEGYVADKGVHILMLGTSSADKDLKEVSIRLE